MFIDQKGILNSHSNFSAKSCGIKSLVMLFRDSCTKIIFNTVQGIYRGYCLKQKSSKTKLNNNKEEI